MNDNVYSKNQFENLLKDQKTFVFVIIVVLFYLKKSYDSSIKHTTNLKRYLMNFIQSFILIYIKFVWM